MISRRTCLGMMVFGTPAVLASGCSKRRDADDKVNPKEPPPVETTWLATMLAVTDAIIGLPIPDHGHYKGFFEWRFANVSPYRDVYLMLVTTLDQRALQAAGTSFVDAAPEVRARLAHDVMDHDTRADGHVRAEVLALFAKTDALVMLGYESWPGGARGFEGLSSLPRNAKP